MFKIIIIAVFLLAAAGISSAQDSIKADDNNNLLIKKWSLAECKENGEKSDFDKTSIVFWNNGKYTYSEDDDKDEGPWELKDNKFILFDKGTPDEEIWEIVHIDEKKLSVKFKDEKIQVEWTFFVSK